MRSIEYHSYLTSLRTDEDNMAAIIFNHWWKDSSCYWYTSKHISIEQRLDNNNESVVNQAHPQAQLLFTVTVSYFKYISLSINEWTSVSDTSWIN